MAETYFGMISAVLLLCAGVVLCAPVSNCGATNISVTCGPSQPAVTTYSMLSELTKNFRDKCTDFFQIYKERTGSLALSDHQNDLPKIWCRPDIGATGDLMATHYNVLKAFKRPLEVVINDENQYPGTQFINFGGLEESLRIVSQAFQDMICYTELQGQSWVDESTDVPWPAAQSYNEETIIRDYTVLYFLRQYSGWLYFSTVPINS